MNRPFAGRIALIAPAAAIADDVLEATLAQLDVLGVDYHLGRHVRARHRYLAGTVEQRLEDLHEAFSLPAIDAVWCLRGGYGSAQLLNGIDWAHLARASARPLIGFSDLSILLEAFTQHQLPAVHGPVATALGQQVLAAPNDQRARQNSLDHLWQLLRGESIHLPAQWHSGQRHTLQGPLQGGNLTALASACGTAGQLRLLPGSVLLLEDVGEPYYRLERSLCQLLESLDGQRPQAVCLGDFTDCPRRGVAHSLLEIVAEYLATLGCALYSGVPSGHDARNLAWRYGINARLGADGLKQ